MNLDIALVLAVLGGATLLFVTEKLRVDIVALLVLLTLTLLDLISPSQAIGGFSNSAVVTVGAVFVLSGGLARTGVAAVLGQRVLRLAGPSELRLTLLIMTLAAFLSAFMNNVGVAALMLPVVMDISRQTEIAPSRLLIPLTFSSLLGGLNTLIGTSPNILVAESLATRGLEPFKLFDFAPVGFAVTLAGILYMAFIGRHLLPKRQGSAKPAGRTLEDLDQLYSLHERLLIIRLLDDSALAGRTLAESRLGSALGLSVVGILRGKANLLAPVGDTVLQAGDRLVAAGDTRTLGARKGGQDVLAPGELEIEDRVLSELEMVEIKLRPDASIIGKTLRDADFRQRFGLNVLAIWRDGTLQRRNLPDWRLEASDAIVVQGTRTALAALRERDDSELVIAETDHEEPYPLHERLRVAHVPPGSSLVGVPLAKNRLGDILGLTVLGIVRDQDMVLMPGPDEILHAEDALLLEGGPKDLQTLQGLQDLRADRSASADLRELETEEVGLADVVLSPQSSLVGKTLRDLQFRERLGLTVLAIWHQGQARYANLQDRPLEFGDGLLLHGRRETLATLRSDSDFLMLSQGEAEAPKQRKAPIAIAIMAGVVTTVLFGLVPIYIAALTGAVVMVLSGCLSIDEAYRAVEWRAVFLIAGMLALGTAMKETGAAAYLADGVFSTIGSLPTMVVVAVVFWLTSAAAQIMPTAAVAVLLAPVAIDTAERLGLSPYAMAMAVAMAASASFMSPVAHPANVMVMGPGGYRFTDYTKVGVPLTLLMFVVVMIVLPLAWPLTGAN